MYLYASEFVLLSSLVLRPPRRTTLGVGGRLRGKCHRMKQQRGRLLIRPILVTLGRDNKRGSVRLFEETSGTVSKIGVSFRGRPRLKEIFTTSGSRTLFLSLRVHSSIINRYNENRDGSVYSSSSRRVSRLRL